jgi:hypothetical protein
MSTAAEFEGIKSMPVFFLDNQHMWPVGATLLKNLVVWPDGGKYPSFKPVSIASHPQFDGMVVVQAGNRRVVVTLLPGVRAQAEIPKAMNRKPEQYCIAIEAIVHAVMLMKAALAAGGEAATDLGGVGDLNKGEPPPDHYTAAEELLQSLSHEVGP